MIYTVGYSALITNWDEKEKDIVRELLDIIATYSVIIIDIRSKPVGLIDKQTLMNKLGEKYRHCPSLGNPMYKKSLNQYNFRGMNICFMCAEKDHRCCHRTEVANYYAIQQYNNGEMPEPSVIHLVSSGIDDDGNEIPMEEPKKEDTTQRALF